MFAGENQQTPDAMNLMASTYTHLLTYEKNIRAADGPLKQQQPVIRDFIYKTVFVTYANILSVGPIIYATAYCLCLSSSLSLLQHQYKYL